MNDFRSEWDVSRLLTLRCKTGDSTTDLLTSGFSLKLTASDRVGNKFLTCFTELVFMVVVVLTRARGLREFFFIIIFGNSFPKFLMLISLRKTYFTNNI